jgi:hypothetical protein
MLRAMMARHASITRGRRGSATTPTRRPRPGAPSSLSLLLGQVNNYSDA